MEVLDACLDGIPAEKALLNWSRGSRFAGSGDRAAVRDLVFSGLRRRRSAAAIGGAETGRGLVLGLLRQDGVDPDDIFTGERHAPPVLTHEERGAPPEGLPEPIRHDLPDWLWARFGSSLGDRAAEAAQALRDRAPVMLRVNRRRASLAEAISALADEGIAAEPHGQVATALRVVSGERRLTRSRAYLDGLVELQDAASQAAVARLPLRDGQSVLDYCAGGGGKALAMADRAALRIDAHDADDRRMRDIPARAARAGVKINMPDRLVRGRYDLVLVDAPCSGSGTWRRSPDAKWGLTPERLDELCALQAGILGEAARMVRPGGLLAYATCSVLEEENGGTVSRFLASHPGWSRRDEMRLLPGPDWDGFYLALLGGE